MTSDIALCTHRTLTLAHTSTPTCPPSRTLTATPTPTPIRTFSATRTHPSPPAPPLPPTPHPTPLPHPQTLPHSPIRARNLRWSLLDMSCPVSTHCINPLAFSSLKLPGASDSPSNTSPPRPTRDRPTCSSNWLKWTLRMVIRQIETNRIGGDDDRRGAGKAPLSRLTTAAPRRPPQPHAHRSPTPLQPAPRARLAWVAPPWTVPIPLDGPSQTTRGPPNSPPSPPRRCPRPRARPRGTPPARGPPGPPRAACVVREMRTPLPTRSSRG